jgi:hypothetical protein
MQTIDLDKLQEAALHGSWGGQGSHWDDCYYTHRDCAVATLVDEVKRLQEAEQRNALFDKCMHRALKIWQERHPEAHYWPDGADNIAWVIDEIERERAENEQLRMRLSLIYGLTYDRDGLVTAESLGQLVDDVCQITQGHYSFEPGNSDDPTA